MKLNNCFIILVATLIIALNSFAESNSNDLCKFTVGPIIKGEATYNVTYVEDDGIAHTVTWLKNAESNAKAIYTNIGKAVHGRLVPVYTNGKLDQKLTSQAVYACESRGFRLPSVDEGVRLGACFGYTDELFQRMPDMGHSDWGTRFWSSTSSIERPGGAYLIATDLIGGTYEGGVNLHAVRCVAR